jgi:hypothetical protein
MIVVDAYQLGPVVAVVHAVVTRNLLAARLGDALVEAVQHWVHRALVPKIE